MADPDNDEAGVDQRSDEPRGLRVVEHHDVAFPAEVQQTGELVVHRAPVDGPLLCSERASVPGRSVEPVVDALRRREEGLIAFDDEPPGSDPAFDEVPEELRQQLRDTATTRRRVHMPQGVALEPIGDRLRGDREPTEIGRERKPLETRGGTRSDIDLSHALPPILDPDDPNTGVVRSTPRQGTFRTSHRDHGGARWLRRKQVTDGVGRSGWRSTSRSGAVAYLIIYLVFFTHGSGGGYGY